MSLNEEQVDFKQQQSALPSAKPAPDTPPTLTETPQPAPIDTPQPSQVPIADPFKNVRQPNAPYEENRRRLTKPRLPLGESAPRSSTREKKKQDFYGQWVEGK